MRKSYTDSEGRLVYEVPGKRKQRARYEQRPTAPSDAAPRSEVAAGAAASGRRSRSPGSTSSAAQGDAGEGADHDSGLVLFMEPRAWFHGS